MYAKGETVIQWFEKFAPKHLALPEDKIGLQLGTLHKEIRKVWVALDITDGVAEEAIGARAELMIAHHALIYRPLQHIRTDLPAGRLCEKLIKHDIAVYIAHTNLDIAQGGINDLLADALGLGGLSPLEASGLGRVGKLAEACSVTSLVEKVKQSFQVPTVRVVGDLARKVRKIAVLGGSGSHYMHQALFAGADVLITGDIDYHTAQDALAAGLVLIDPGHNIEKFMKTGTADYLNKIFQSNKVETRAAASQIDTEPFTFV